MMVNPQHHDDDEPIHLIPADPPVSFTRWDAFIVGVITGAVFYLLAFAVYGVSCHTSG